MTEGKEGNRVMRDAKEEDFSEILRLNEESVHFLSLMDMEKLVRLDREAAFHKVITIDDKVRCFCLAFREGAPYESVNYRWFQDHFDVFLYVDRVVVDQDIQNEGLGKLMYEEVFKFAKANNAKRVTAEIDVVPENPVSLKFHDLYGFKEVGRQEVYNGAKVVSLRVAEIDN